MLIIEGIDGVGKTTLVEYLQSYGMKKYHFDYYFRILGQCVRTHTDIFIQKQ